MVVLLSLCQVAMPKTFPTSLPRCSVAGGRCPSCALGRDLRVKLGWRVKDSWLLWFLCGIHYASAFPSIPQSPHWEILNALTTILCGFLALLVEGFLYLLSAGKQGKGMR